MALMPSEKSIDIGYNSISQVQLVATMASGTSDVTVNYPLDQFSFLLARIYDSQSSAWLASQIIPTRYFVYDSDSHWNAIHFYIGATKFSWLFKRDNTNKTTKVNLNNAGGNGSFYLYGINIKPA